MFHIAARHIGISALLVSNFPAKYVLKRVHKAKNNTPIVNITTYIPTPTYFGKNIFIKNESRDIMIIANIKEKE